MSSLSLAAPAFGALLFLLAFFSFLLAFLAFSFDFFFFFFFFGAAAPTLVTYAIIATNCNETQRQSRRGAR